MRYLIVAGGRDFYDHDKAYTSIKELVTKIDEDVTIVSGGARGADHMGEVYADLHDLQLIRFPANWDKHGKAAGPIRNAEMAEVGTDLLAFWDNKSRGTKNMIDNATKKGLNVTVVYY